MGAGRSSRKPRLRRAREHLVRERGEDVKEQTITTILDLFALTLIVTGVALIFIPAALIVAGFGMAVVSWQASR